MVQSRYVVSSVGLPQTIRASQPVLLGSVDFFIHLSSCAFDVRLRRSRTARTICFKYSQSRLFVSQSPTLGFGVPWCCVSPHFVSSCMRQTVFLPCAVPNICIPMSFVTVPACLPLLAALTVSIGNPHVLPSVLQGEADEALTCLVQKKDESEL